MFERLVLALSSDEDYLDIFLLSVLFTLVAVLLVRHLVVFRVSGTNLGGLIVVLLTTLGVSYPFVRYIIQEEQAEMRARWTEKRLLARHAHQLELYLAFFTAVTFAFALATFFVPEAFFTVQFDVLQSIRGPTGNVVGGPLFTQILANNAWVFVITFVLTFFLASGILFVLAWNASVLGVLIGTLAKSVLHIPYVTLFYAPHGILEISAYVLAGIAGSLLSYRVEADLFDDVAGAAKMAVTRDAVMLVGIGALFLIVAAAVEVI